MSTIQPTVSDTDGRIFATFPVAVIALMVNQDEEFLLLSQKPGRWEAVKGALEAGETIENGMCREVREELGSEVRCRFLGTVHAMSTQGKFTFPAVSVFCLMAYEGGEIFPGDDMAGSQIKWWTLDDLYSDGEHTIPFDEWLFSHAIEIYRLLV